MSRRDLDLEETLPLELKLRVLQAELDRLESDFHWLEQRREEITRQISEYQERLTKTRRRTVLRRVK